MLTCSSSPVTAQVVKDQRLLFGLRLTALNCAAAERAAEASRQAAAAAEAARAAAHVDAVLRLPLWAHSVVCAISVVLTLAVAAWAAHRLHTLEMQHHEVFAPCLAMHSFLVCPFIAEAPTCQPQYHPRTGVTRPRSAGLSSSARASPLSNAFLLLCIRQDASHAFCTLITCCILAGREPVLVTRAQAPIQRL